jgi:hypothetical protein
MDRIKGRSDFSELRGDRYDTCYVCGPVVYRVVVHFDGSSATPTVGETITGVTTLDTGVVEGFTMTSATAGVMILTSPTGYDAESSVMFQDNEALTGTTSGASFALVDGGCGVNKSGRMQPDRNLIEYAGKKYCVEHFKFMFEKTWQDEAKIDTNEPLRGK